MAWPVGGLVLSTKRVAGSGVLCAFSLKTCNSTLTALEAGAAAVTFATAEGAQASCGLFDERLFCAVIMGGALAGVKTLRGLR